MIPLVSKLVEKDSRLAATPAMKRVQKLASLPHVEFVQREHHTQSAADLHALWALRLANMTRKKRRFVGLPNLVRNLALLDSTTQVKQIILRTGPTRGLIFYTAAGDKPLGAVISVLTTQDERRAAENWLRATGNMPRETKPATSRSLSSGPRSIAALKR